MSSKLYPTLATLAVAVASAVATSGALAVEATQWNPEAGSATRATVQAEKAPVGVKQYGEATVFVDQPSTQTRALARSQQGEPALKVVRLGEATEFIDAPGVRSREEVRAETLAALRAGRR
jgi:hypothetical protein